MTIALPDPAGNVLERWLWFADRLEEAGVLYDPRADVRDLAALYRETYHPLYERAREARRRLLAETAP